MAAAEELDAASYLDPGPPAPPSELRWCASDVLAYNRPTSLAAICGGPTKTMPDDGMDDILKSIKDAQRNALMERAWKVAHEEMRRAGLSDTTIASGHIMAAMTLWQRELRKRGAEQAEIANKRYLLKHLFDGLFDRCWDALHKS